MNYRKVTAIIPQITLDQVEEELLAIDVPGMTVSKAHGMGDYRNYYTNDYMTNCSRLEVFIEADKAKLVAKTIAHTVHQGMNSDGIIAILPVEEFIHIKDYIEE